MFKFLCFIILLQLCFCNAADVEESLSKNKNVETINVSGIIYLLIQFLLLVNTQTICHTYLPINVRSTFLLLNKNPFQYFLGETSSNKEDYHRVDAYPAEASHFLYEDGYPNFNRRCQYSLYGCNLNYPDRHPSFFGSYDLFYKRKGPYSQ